MPDMESAGACYVGEEQLGVRSRLDVAVEFRPYSLCTWMCALFVESGYECLPFL